MTVRPKRHYRPDALAAPFTTSEDLRVSYAVAPFDHAARLMDQKFGIDRLPQLVSTATAEKYGSALAKLNAAIAAQDPTETAARAAVCMRGLVAMEAEAIAAGHTPLPPEAWPVTVDGKPGVVIRDAAAWTLAEAAHPGCRVYTLQEVANALAHYGGMVAAAKDAFPGATVTAIRPKTKLEDDLSDFIPF